MNPSDLPDIPWWIPVAVDTETSGVHPDDLVYPEPIGVVPGQGQGPRASVSTVSVAYCLDDEMFSFAWPFDQGNSSQPTLFDADTPNLEYSEWEALMDWLDGRRLVMHNAKFDLWFLNKGHRLWEGRDFSPYVIADTMLMCRILWPTHSASLKATSVRLGLLGGNAADEQEALKKWIRSAKLGPGIGTDANPRFDLVPWSVMEPYATKDAELTIALYNECRELFDRNEGDPSILDREMDLMLVLYNMEQRGMGFDRQGCAGVAADIQKKMNRIARKLPFQPTPKGAKEYYFNKLNYEPHDTTDTGQAKMDEETRRALIRQKADWIEEYDLWCRLNSAHSKWFHPWPDMVGADDRIRCSFQQGFVRSERLSVRRVQLQAIPKEGSVVEEIPNPRKFFQPASGKELWNLDLSQAELRVAAKYADCQSMMEMLLQGADIHGNTCRSIFGIETDDPDWKIKRDVAKRLTFGSIFQIGPATFQETLSRDADIHWSVAACKDAVYGWRNLYPEFTYAYQRFERMAQRHGFVEIVGGEKSWFSDRDFSNTGWSRRVQGSLAKFLKLWLIELEKLWPGILVLTVHDSVVLELPEGEGAQIADDVARHAEVMATKLFGIEMRVDVGLWHKD